MPPVQEADGNKPVSKPRCEIAKTLRGEECESLGEVRHGGMLLCGPHAALLSLEYRANAILGSVFLMDEWLQENGDSSSEEEYLGRVRHEREEAAAALRRIRAQIRSARKARSVGSR